MDLEGLDGAWRAFLETVPVDLETQIQAGESFDADLWPGYLDRCCPKLGETEQPPRDKAQSLWYAGDYDRALRLYQELYDRDGKTQWGYQIAQCCRKLDRLTDAAALLDKLLARPGLTEYERGRLLRAKTSCLMAQGNWPALETAFNEQHALKQDPSKDRDMIEACLHNPDLREPIAKALTTEDAYEKRRILEDLVHQHPGEAGLRYLYATRAFGSLNAGWGLSIPAERKTQVAALLDYLEQAPESADRLAGQLGSFADRAILVKEFGLAERISNALTRFCAEPLHQYRARRALDRVAFEQTQN
jgi:tetratricopeptide (TPR) repeat protein